MRRFATVLKSTSKRAAFNAIQKRFNTIQFNKLSKQELVSVAIRASAAGDLPVLKQLVKEAKYDLNLGDYDNRTPLHLAAAEGKLEVVKFLVENGANVNTVDRWNSTPLNEAEKYNHKEVSEYLTSKGGKIYTTRTIKAAYKESDMDQVFKILNEKGVFESTLLYAEIYRFFSELGMHENYFRHFTVEQIASHIQGFIAAKKVAQSTGQREDYIFLANETEDFAYYMCPTTKDAINQTEAKIEKYINSTPKTHGFSLYHYTSNGKITQSSDLTLSLYVVKRYEHKDVKGELEGIASKGFFESMKNKTETTKNRYIQVAKQASEQLKPVLVKFPAENGLYPVMIGLQNASEVNLGRLTEFIETIPGLQCKQKFIESMKNGTSIASLWLQTENESDVDEFLNKASLLAVMPKTEFDQLLADRTFSARQLMYAHSASLFTFYFASQQSEEFKLLREHLKNDPTNMGRLLRLQQRLKNDALTMNRIAQAVYSNIDIAKQLYADFEEIHTGKRAPTLNKELGETIRKNVQDPLDKTILDTFLTFNHSTLKSNFYARDKVAVGFRLDPSKFLGEGTAYPEAPYGIFMFVGNDFIGFHVRFQDVARGGVRVIKSRSKQVWRNNAESLFTENYNLAWTQDKKNKDIPEGGSKGTVLLSPDHQENVKTCFKKYIETALDLMLVTDGVVDHLKSEEILYLGPDENSADMMDWAALHSKARGYKYWKAFTTGKSPQLGGIPHDTYGMTTNSVHQCALGVLRMLGLEEEKVTKVQTGGPDGDLGSNEILISKDITKAVIDGSGVVYDPNGLNREELVRLAKLRSMIENYDESKLGPGGFKVLITDKNKTLPTGEVVENGETFRNTFHLHDLFEADLFVPCGGRPQAINISNVKQLFKADGTPKIKYLVEGANLFVTQDARLVLEKAGIVNIKDATANKGGVTSSSLEVLGALAMTDEEFEANLQEQKNGELPEFYKEYVNEVLERIRENARLEFEAIWRDNQKSGIPRPVLTDMLSTKINSLNSAIQASNLWEDKEFVMKVMKEALPQTLQRKVGLDNIMKRVPESYLKAIFGCHLAARYVYKYGIDANEFDFFEYMGSYKA